MIRVIAAFAALLGLALLAGSATAAHHEGGEAKAAALPPWDQAAAASLARELQASAKELRAMERNMPLDTMASGQARAREEYRQVLRGLEVESRALGDQLEKGKSREDTTNLFLRIQELGRDAAEEARRMFLSKATIDEIQKAEATMNKLRVYYKGSPDPHPALVGPSEDESTGGKKAN